MLQTLRTRCFGRCIPRRVLCNVLVATAVLLPGGFAWAAGGGIQMKLEVSADPSGAVWPYGAADLALANRSAAVLREVRLRWTEGGPTVICPVALAPDAEQVVRVYLPAGAPLQTYAATFRGDPLLEPATVTMSWPIERVAREAWVSASAFEPYDRSPPTWSGPVRLNVMLGAVLAALAAAATLFLPSQRMRTSVLLAVAATATAAAASTLAQTDVLVEDVIPLESPQPGIAASPGRNLHVVAARRTLRWTHPDARVAPVYRDESELAEETMTLDPRRGASVVIAPGQLRLFRAAPAER